MSEKVNGKRFMNSLRKKWGTNPGLKRKVGKIVGSANKQQQLEYLLDEYQGLSRLQIEKKLRGLYSPRERKHFIESNEELSRVFGIEKDGETKQTRGGRRKELIKAKLHKQANIRSGRNVAKEIRNKKNNRLEGVYSKEAGTAEGYGYANVVEEGHHNVSAQNVKKRVAETTKGSNTSLTRESGAKPLINDRNPLPSGNSGFKQGPNLIPRGR